MKHSMRPISSEVNVHIFLEITTWLSMISKSWLCLTKRTQLFTSMLETCLWLLELMQMPSKLSTMPILSTRLLLPPSSVSDATAQSATWKKLLSRCSSASTLLQMRSLLNSISRCYSLSYLVSDPSHSPRMTKDRKMWKENKNRKRSSKTVSLKSIKSLRYSKKKNIWRSKEVRAKWQSRLSQMLKGLRSRKIFIWRTWQSRWRMSLYKIWQMNRRILLKKRPNLDTIARIFSNLRKCTFTVQFSRPTLETMKTLWVTSTSPGSSTG